MVKVAILGMVIPPLIGILIMGPHKPLRNWVDVPIPYYMEIMGVDRPDRTGKGDNKQSLKPLLVTLEKRRTMFVGFFGSALWPTGGYLKPPPVGLDWATLQCLPRL